MHSRTATDGGRLAEKGRRGDGTRSRRSSMSCFTTQQLIQHRPRAQGQGAPFAKTASVAESHAPAPDAQASVPEPRPKCVNSLAARDAPVPACRSADTPLCQASPGVRRTNILGTTSFLISTASLCRCPGWSCHSLAGAAAGTLTRRGGNKWRVISLLVPANVPLERGTMCRASLRGSN